MIGCDTTVFANAVIAGSSDCPIEIIIPREFTNEGRTGPVETIGQYAFYRCSLYEYYPTRTVFVTKQVKTIKNDGFSFLDFVTNFTIEPGSQLETIDKFGLYNIGFSSFPSSLTTTLVFPSTLSSVAPNGIVYCNLFTNIVYCGINDLSMNSSSLESADIADIIVRVSSSYTPERIFGIMADKSTDISQECTVPIPAQTQAPSISASPKPTPTPSASSSASPTASQSPSASLSSTASQSPIPSASPTVSPSIEFITTDLSATTIMIGVNNNIDANGVVNCPSGGITIPESIDGKSVISIAPKAFKGCNSHGSITLPYTLEDIGSEAFSDNNYATGLFIPHQGNLIQIEEQAFLGLGSGIENAFQIILSKNLKSIGKDAFKHSNVNKIIIL